jgi:hypothetical protein
LAATDFTLDAVDHVAGNEGCPRSKFLPGSLPAPAPTALWPNYAAKTANVNANATLRMTIFTLEYPTKNLYATERAHWPRSL